MFAPFKAAMAPGHNAGYQPGVYRRYYDGYFGANPAWFAGATLLATDKIVGSINIGSIDPTRSFQFLGYFRATKSENFTFTMSSDDQAYFWIGNNALNGNFNAGNAKVL